MYRRLMQAAIVATIATILSSAALAQPANNAATPPAATPPVDTRDDDRDFDEWGLLGLFGLLGLWPRKRRDVVDDRRTTTPAR